MLGSQGSFKESRNTNPQTDLCPEQQVSRDYVAAIGGVYEDVLVAEWECTHMCVYIKMYVCTSYIALHSLVLFESIWKCDRSIVTFPRDLQAVVLLLMVESSSNERSDSQYYG